MALMDVGSVGDEPRVLDSSGVRTCSRVGELTGELLDDGEVQCNTYSARYQVTSPGVYTFAAHRVRFWILGADLRFWVCMTCKHAISVTPDSLPAVGRHVFDCVKKANGGDGVPVGFRRPPKELVEAVTALYKPCSAESPLDLGEIASLDIPSELIARGPGFACARSDCGLAHLDAALVNNHTMHCGEAYHAGKYGVVEVEVSRIYPQGPYFIAGGSKSPWHRYKEPSPAERGQLRREHAKGTFAQQMRDIWEKPPPPPPPKHFHKTPFEAITNVLDHVHSIPAEFRARLLDLPDADDDEHMPGLRVAVDSYVKEFCKLVKGPRYLIARKMIMDDE